MKPIVIVGSINMDLVSHTSRIPVAGETVTGEAFQMHSGGKGANQAVAVARLAYPSILLGMLGEDLFGRQLLTTLNEFGVSTEHLGTTKGSSGTASIVVDAQGENTIIVNPGANLQVTPEYLRSKLEIIQDAGIVLAQLEIPVDTIVWLAGYCKDLGIPLMLDPAPAQSLPLSIFQELTWFTPNETEAAFYSHQDESTEDMLARLFNMGVRNVILKQGAKGVIVAQADGTRDCIQPFPVNAKDSTAAGDAFNGAFAVAWMQGNSPAESGRFAAAAAAISVAREGAQSSLATLSEVLSVLSPRQAKASEGR